MATEPSPPGSPQRRYRAACPNCGAPVEFRSAASAFAVCGFCRSTIVREGQALRKIGESAELFDDHTPLQLGVSGSVQGDGFTLVGRLQYRYAQGTWNEWHAFFDNGRSGWLSEDNGAYVLGFDEPLAEAPPLQEKLFVGMTPTVGGKRWSVASVTTARLIAAQGELPGEPNTKGAFVVADLRSAGGEVGTLDYSRSGQPVWSVGRSVVLDELKLAGVSDDTEQTAKTMAGRAVECPNCGASLEVTLATTQSIVCSQCRSVIDLSQGVGGDLHHYQQMNSLEPLIPLGTVGHIRLGKKAPARPWQVVGYVERCELPEDSDDEVSYWREYLLYHRTAGFAFLIDAEDGWSWSAPITGAPEQSGDKVKYQDVGYRKLYTYTGQVTYVLGEFYWQLEREQKTYNTDYQSGTKRLNREETRSGPDSEVVWSAGETLDATEVAKAFKLAPDQAQAMARDVTPSAGGSSMIGKVIFWMVVVIVLLMIFRCSSGDNCSDIRSTYGSASQEYQSCVRSNSSGSRSGGGSFGGFSSGGGHK
ncbi:MAG: hypothetical protein RLZZ618_315 [Pseudomonadota bacterium]